MFFSRDWFERSNKFPQSIYSQVVVVVGMAVVIFQVIRQCENFLKNLLNGKLSYLYQAWYFNR